MIRGNSQQDANSFIKDDASDNYLKRISNCVRIQPSQWSTFTGSVKVLASDLTRDTGNFMFCVDGIPAGNINVYMDNVRIWRLSDEGITNGTFSDGVIGWRSWTEYTTPMPLTIDSSLFAKYIRVAEYGSIACNVDQILSYYGPGRYTLSFSMRVDNASESETPFIFYLTSNFTQYHQWIHQQVITPNSGWQAISIPLTIDATTFALLNPDEKEVHFRIQCPEQERPPYHTEYSIDNVSLTPAPVTALGDLPEGEQPMAVGQQLQLPSPGIIPNYTPGRLDWYSSNPSIATVNASGVVSGHAPGTVTITAKARSGGATSSCTVAVKQLIDGFVDYGQEQLHQCWAACAKMLAAQYIRNTNGDDSRLHNSLANDISAIGETPGEVNDQYAQNRLINYYLYRDSNYASLTMYYAPLSETKIVELINNNSPITMHMEGYRNGIATGISHSCVIYGYYYRGNKLWLEYVDPAGNGNTGKLKSQSLDNIKSTFNTTDGYVWFYSYYIE